MTTPNVHVKLIRRSMTLEDALEDEDNILQALSYPRRRHDLCVYLLESQDEILTIVAHHLGVQKTACKLALVEDWLYGSFNWCIPIDVKARGRSRFMFRVPLPYKIGEAECPGNMEEKLRTEAATYIHLSANHPEIPIPKLWGFGLPNGLSFTALENTSWLCRARRRFMNCLRGLFRLSSPCSFTQAQTTTLSTGYLLIDYVERGTMLSETFTKHRSDSHRRENLFRDISRIMLSLSNAPLPPIGSLTVNDDCYFSLNNRPLTLRLQCLENVCIPTGIARQTTFTSVDSYLLSLLAYHDNRLKYQPNSINDETDGRQQMAALVLMRALLNQFTIPETRRGPFILDLTDMQPSNIFVDEEWNIVAIIDLEWACALPIELQHPPSWITGADIDDLIDENLEEFCRVREELALSLAPTATRTEIMQKSWQQGGFWYGQALATTKGMYNLFIQHVQSRFTQELPFGEVSVFWGREPETFIRRKLEEREEYLAQLKQAALAHAAELDDGSDGMD